MCAAAALPLTAQVIASGEHWPGVQLYFDAKIEPPPPPTTDPAILRQLARDVPGGVIGAAGVHRYWKDAEQKLYVGYDVAVEMGSQPQVFRIRISPLSIPPDEMTRFGIEAGWRCVSLPKYPVIPDVRIGDTVVIDLLVNPATGQKIVDYLTLQRRVALQRSQIGDQRPHDVSPADAGLTISDPRLSVDGKPLEATAHFTGGISGPTVWIYLQGRGRFVLSLQPGRRFQQAGEVYAKTLTFASDGVRYQMHSSSPIATGVGHFSLYVLHEESWRPTGGDANETFILGSSPGER
jgi:hypothetical protein